MAVVFQGSLFSESPPEASGGGLPALSGVRRTVLAHGAWIDLLPGWLPDPDALFEHLAETVPWRAEEREMYERVVGVPRLLAHYGEQAELPHPLLARARTALNVRYAAESGGPFRTSGLCYYRDGRDSVAWHGDRSGRGRTHDTMVAILSVGEPRALQLRPRGGGPAQVRLSLGHGDLLVMGGSCQRTWDHAVPKTARPVGPRISIQFRPRGVS
ncbi:alpha-ketoglutarate-dependent dioxygenase AlkB [Streptacidiphilus sp. N1-12]|uniref:Alpha-ketoglutarate-dependent dioxygenase AlkB n=2 Tax=Streptacidiphilus alkalitolerans TaxID=3342712 RepID=A0ABV6WDV0_9ACTN